eukprot:s1460_g5.t1
MYSQITSLGVIRIKRVALQVGSLGTLLDDAAAADVAGADFNNFLSAYHIKYRLADPGVPHTLHGHVDDVASGASSIRKVMSRVRNQLKEWAWVKKKNGEILLTAKAYNGRIILMWLTHCLLDAVQHHPDHQILLMTSVAMSSLARFMTTMEANGRFLTQEAAESLHDSGMKFVNMHRALSVAHIRC